MSEYILDILMNYEIAPDMAKKLSSVILALIVIFLSFVGNMITKKIVIRVIAHYIRNNKFKWDTIILERKVFHKLSHIVPAMIIYSFSTAFPTIENFLKTAVNVYIVFVLLLFLDAFLSAINDIYMTFRISKNKPIKGYIQVIKIFIFIIGGIIIVSAIIGQDPLVLLGGIGALTAVLLLVFQDSILGLVAGIQLSTNDMVRLGDWIEMPKYGADGDVIDITLNTVKVQNFDRTIVTIPTYALISDSFKNWRGMQETGGRRIKRAINIDVSSITFCTDEMLERFEKIHHLSDYIRNKKREIEKYNKENNIDPVELVNGRHMTNIGTFRAYIDKYLENHPKVHHGLIRMVRQLPPGEHGLPIEIYVFTNTTEWVDYESIQADIFDHIMAVVPEFGLRIFQEPTGHDWRNKFEGSKT